MADHPHVGLRDAQRPAGFGSRPLVEEGHDDHRALTLPQRLDAASQAVRVERRHLPLRGHEHTAKLFEQLFLAARTPALIEDRHAAGAEHEVGQLVRIPQPAGPKRLQHLHQYLLNEIVRGRGRPQMPQAVQADAWSHASAHLGLGLGVARSDSLRKGGIAQFDVHATILRTRRSSFEVLCHRSVSLDATDRPRPAGH